MGRAVNEDERPITPWRETSNVQHRMKKTSWEAGRLES